MTPPSAKPDSNATDGAQPETATPDTSTDVVTDAVADVATPERGDVQRPPAGGRRRAASLELRVARQRSSAEADLAEGRAAGPGARRWASANAAGTRTGPRALARAAKAALAEGGDVTDGDQQPQDMTVVPTPAGTSVVHDVVFTSVRSARAPVDLPAMPPAARVEVQPTGAALVRTPAPALPAVVEEDDEDDDDRAPGPGARRRAVARGERRAARPFKANDPSHYVVAPTVSAAQMRPRHYGVIALFLLCVIVPTITYSWYLWTRAADQYESDVGFGSRTEEAPSTFDFLGALGGGTQSGSKDMDILNQFIISQELVAKIDAELDLKAMWSMADDPLNAFNPDGTIENLLAHWQRMVLVNYDNSTGLMNLRVFAYDPLNAQKIAKAVLRESTSIINELSKTAQHDTTRYSTDALTATEAKLADARLAVLDFQVRNNIVDPLNVVANQLSVVSTLNQQLATAQIDYDMLAGTVPASDPRQTQLSRRLEVIRNRITEEQAKVGATADSNSPGFAKLMADFERLKVDQDFAQQAYLSALAAHAQALTDAQQKTRYLAAYVDPTLAEAPTAPNRPMTAAMTALIGFLIWSVLVLTYYALRDRR